MYLKYWGEKLYLRKIKLLTIEMTVVSFKDEFENKGILCYCLKDIYETDLISTISCMLIDTVSSSLIKDNNIYSLDEQEFFELNEAIGLYATKEDAEKELENISKAIEDGKKVYEISFNWDELISKLKIREKEEEKKLLFQTFMGTNFDNRKNIRKRMKKNEKE